MNGQVINDILRCNIRNINVKYNSNKIIKFKSVVAWEQAMFSCHINLRTNQDALLRDQRFARFFACFTVSKAIRIRSESLSYSA